MSEKRTRKYKKPFSLKHVIKGGGKMEKLLAIQILTIFIFVLFLLVYNVFYTDFRDTVHQSFQPSHKWYNYLKCVFPVKETEKCKVFFIKTCQKWKGDTDTDNVSIFFQFPYNNFLLYLQIKGLCLYNKKCVFLLQKTEKYKKLFSLKHVIKGGERWKNC